MSGGQGHPPLARLPLPGDAEQVALHVFDADVNQLANPAAGIEQQRQEDGVAGGVSRGVEHAPYVGRRGPRLDGAFLPGRLDHGHGVSVPEPLRRVLIESGYRPVVVPLRVACDVKAG